MSSVWAIVVAAGSGSRFGRRKQFEPLAGSRVLDWSLRAAAAACDGVVAVVPADRADDPTLLADAVVPGGVTRSASVRAGLAAVPLEAEIVVVHDGARPLASPRAFEMVVTAVRQGADAAVPGVPVTDTLRRRSGGGIDRDDVVAVQTPQAFRASALRAAHDRQPDATDDAGLIEAAGGRVVVVEGDPSNLKLTRPEDLAVAEALLATQAAR